MKNLRKTTVTNAENKMVVQKFEKKTWKKLMKTKIKIWNYWQWKESRQRSLRYRGRELSCLKDGENFFPLSWNEAKVEIEDCVRMFMKLEFGEIFLKCKRKSVKYPQRKFMKLSLLKIRKLLMIKMKKVLPKLRKLFTKDWLWKLRKDI